MHSLPFLGLEGDFASVAESRIVVVPIPLEKTTTYQQGTKNAPTALLKASEYLEFYDAYFGQQTCRVGIGTDRSLDCRPPLKQCIAHIYERSLYWFEQHKFPFFIGGEHSVSIGVFQALKEKFGSVTILQIDAHADLRNSYHGSPFNHACVMARARDCGHNIVQCGVRALSQEEALLIDNDPQITCYYDHDDSWKTKQLKKVVEDVKGPVYLTIDVDGLNPHDMPATGTPVPGGLNWNEINHLLDSLFSKAEVIGADICELKPHKFFKHCDFYAATLAYRIMGHKAKQAGWKLKGDVLSEQL